MSRIAFFCIPAHGHTNPTLGVVRELTARGHEVLYYSYEPFREKIETAGARFVPCEAYDAEMKLTEKEATRIGSDLALSTRVLVDTTLALDDAVCAEMEKWQPDCIVADSMAVWGKAVARKLGIPFVSSTTTFAFNQYSAKLMKQSIGQMVSLLASMPKINKDLQRLRDKGYPVQSVLDLIQNDEHTHTIVYTSPQFQPCAETFSDKYAFVGPSIRPAGSEIVKIREKLVYISMGTVNNEMLPLYQNCIAALKDMGCQVILSVGEKIDPKAFGELPEQIRAYAFVDQIAVLQKADVFLTHCGMNSASEALYYGVPLVMLPKTSEQGAVAARTEQLGAGLRLKKTTPAAIRRAVEQVLADPAYRENAGKIAAGFRQCPGASGAADKIEKLCSCEKR